VRVALLLGLLAAGCVTKVVEPAAAPTAAPGLVIRCERAKVVVPDGDPVAFDAKWGFTRGEVTVRTTDISVEAAGADFSVVAEGNVHVGRSEGGRTFEEGPYRMVILRNGELLRR
jgi:hypothetical protein